MCFKELSIPSCEKTERVIRYFRILGGQLEFETRTTWMIPALCFAHLFIGNILQCDDYNRDDNNLLRNTTIKKKYKTAVVLNVLFHDATSTIY